MYKILKLIFLINYSNYTHLAKTIIMGVSAVLAAIYVAFAKTVGLDGEKTELTEADLAALGCRLVPFSFEGDSLPDAVLLSNSVIFFSAGPEKKMREATEPVVGGDCYAEDGTAGAWETSGNCARASFNQNFAGDVSPFIVVDGETHFPLDALDIYSGGYATCSCYQPEDVATFDDYEETREVISSLLRGMGYDPVKSFMSGTLVKEPVDEEPADDDRIDYEAMTRVAADTVIKEAVLDFSWDMTGYVLVVPPELIPSEEKDDSSHLADRLAEFDAFGDGELAKTDELESKD